MRREMIVGFVVGLIAGAGADLLFRTSGAGLIGGALVGGIIGYFLIPARERAALQSGGGDGGGYLGDTVGHHASPDCGDSGSDGGSCDGGGGD